MVADRRLRQAQRACNRGQIPGQWVGKIDAHPARQDLGVPPDMLQIIDGSAGNACRFQGGEPPCAGSCTEQFLEDGNKRVTIGDAAAILCIARIGWEIGAAGDRAEAGELSVIAGSDDHVTVKGGENLVGNDVLVGIAGALGHLAGNQIVHVQHGQHRHLRIQQRDIDMLTFAGGALMGDGRQNSDRRIHAGHQIGDGDANFLGAAAGEAVFLAGY